MVGVLGAVHGARRHRRGRWPATWEARVDYFIMRFIEMVLGLPYMLLVIILMAIFGRNTGEPLRGPRPGQLADRVPRWCAGRSSVLQEQRVRGGRQVVGAGPGRIIFRHLLPNTLGIIVVFATLRVPHLHHERVLPVLPGAGRIGTQACWGSLMGEGAGVACSCTRGACSSRRPR